MMDYIGNVFAIEPTDFGNFYNPTTRNFSMDPNTNQYDKRYSETYIRFAGWKIGWHSNTANNAILTRRSINLNHPVGCYLSTNGIAQDRAPSPNNYYSAGDREKYVANMGQRIFPQSITGQAATCPNAIPGYYRVSRNDDRGDVTADNDIISQGGFIMVDGGSGNYDFGYILFAKLKDKQAFANDIIKYNPGMFSSLLDKVYAADSISDNITKWKSIYDWESDLSGYSNAVVTTLRALETVDTDALTSLTTIDADNSNAGKKTNICLMYPDSCLPEAISYITNDTKFDNVSTRWCDLASHQTVQADHVFLTKTAAIKAACINSYANANCKAKFSNVSPPQKHFTERFSHIGGNEIGFRDIPINDFPEQPRQNRGIFLIDDTGRDLSSDAALDAESGLISLIITIIAIMLISIVGYHIAKPYCAAKRFPLNEALNVSTT